MFTTCDYRLRLWLAVFHKLNTEGVDSELLVSSDRNIDESKLNWQIAFIELN